MYLNDDNNNRNHHIVVSPQERARNEELQEQLNNNARMSPNVGLRTKIAELEAANAQLEADLRR